MMKFKIRKGIRETSSSSANAIAMLSKNGSTDIPQLTKTFKLVKGYYDTCGDGVLHIYLNNWMDKMSYLAEDTEVWHEMFKQATGQDFEMWDCVEITDEKLEIIKKNGIEYEPFPEYNPDEPFGDYAFREKEYGYICGYDNWDLSEEIVIVRAKDISHYGLKRQVAPHEWYENIRWKINEITSEIDSKLIQELIFNSAFAINIGGDAFDGDTRTIPPYQSKEDKNPFLRRHFTELFRYYDNGTERLLVAEDGTRIRIFDEDTVPEYPESIDLKITDYCENNCPFCYENCTSEGKHGEPAKFLDSLPQFVELAVGGGNPLAHPHFTDFLYKTYYVNATLHAKDFSSLFDGCEKYGKADYEELIITDCSSVGISVSSKYDSDILANLFDNIRWRDESLIGYDFAYISEGGRIYERFDTVIHVVNGVITEDILKPLFDKDLKLLVLGFKTKGKGVEYANNPSVAENQKWLYDNIEEVAKHFKIIAFDNLALKQLDMRRFLTDEEWETMYMGDDGLHSMYVDLVKGEYGISSTDDRRWPLTDDIRDMFKHVREVVLSEKKKDIQGGE